MVRDLLAGVPGAPQADDVGRARISARSPAARAHAGTHPSTRAPPATKARAPTPFLCEIATAPPNTAWSPTTTCPASNALLDATTPSPTAQSWPTCTPHQQAPAAYFRDRVRTGRAVDLRVLAYVVAVADDQVRRERRRVLLSVHVAPTTACAPTTLPWPSTVVPGSGEPTTACDRTTQSAPSVVAPRMCTPAPSSQLGPMTASSDTTQNGPMRAPARDGGVLPDERTRMDPEELAGRAGMREAHRAVRRGGGRRHATHERHREPCATNFAAARIARARSARDECRGRANLRGSFPARKSRRPALRQSCREDRVGGRFHQFCGARFRGVSASNKNAQPEETRPRRIAPSDAMSQPPSQQLPVPTLRAQNTSAVEDADDGQRKPYGKRYPRLDQGCARRQVQHLHGAPALEAATTRWRNTPTARRW